MGRPRGCRPFPTGCNNFVTWAITVGELFLESLSSGVITQPEIDWLLRGKTTSPGRRRHGLSR
jgi:hypothetical protein